MRWLSPPESVPAVRESVRYSSPTSTRNCSRSLISLRMRRAISRCFGVQAVVERREPARGFGDGELRDIADVQVAHLDAERLRLQPMAAAALARGGALELAELVAQPGAVGLAPAPVQVGHHALEGLGRAVLADAVVVGEGDPLLAGAVDDRLPHLRPADRSRARSCARRSARRCTPGSGGSRARTSPPRGRRRPARG